MVRLPAGDGVNSDRNAPRFGVGGSFAIKGSLNVAGDTKVATSSAAEPVPPDPEVLMTRYASFSLPPPGGGSPAPGRLQFVSWRGCYGATNCDGQELWLEWLQSHRRGHGDRRGRGRAEIPRLQLRPGRLLGDTTICQGDGGTPGHPPQFSVEGTAYRESRAL
jgi:hypothetical protein